MFKLLKITSRQLVACISSRHMSVLCLLHRNRFKLSLPDSLSVCKISVFRSEVLNQNELSDSISEKTMSTSRLYSGRRRRQTATTERVYNEILSDTFASIDPSVEEEFVFLDHIIAEEADQNELLLNVDPHSVIAEKEKEPTRSCPEKQTNALKEQLESINDATTTVTDSDALIEFHDAQFPFEKQSKKKTKPIKQHKVYGTPDNEMAHSDICCSGCGAVMHCAAPEEAGYLPSEKYKSLLEENQLRKSICQRCYLFVNHQKALTIKMSKEEYRDVVRSIKPEKALVLLIVDLLDIPDSIIPDLLELVGKNKNIVVLGNKIDLLPGDSINYLHRIKRQLTQYCTDVGISTGNNIKNVHLISAKTGYGIENLISSLQMSWKYKGDVYLVGTANSGKSTLFNTLLESDYCKSKASDVIHKATISPWPGTTLNLLKFPIINPTPYRMFKRSERLKTTAQQTEQDLSPQELKQLTNFSKKGYLVGRVGRTFRVEPQTNRGLIEFDPDGLSFGEDMLEEKEKALAKSSTEVEFTPNELKNAHWLYDTPGIMKDKDILSLLTEQEVKIVVPTQAITPRTFVLNPGMVLFVGALGRIDYLQGKSSCMLTVIASTRIPVHITSLEKADHIYQKHAGNVLLGVPVGGQERMKDFPLLVPRDVQLQGQGHQTVAADIKLSSAGWVAVTGAEEDQLSLRAYAPAGAGLSVRSPPLLPHIVNVKGKRIQKSPAYKTRKPQALVDTTLSDKGAKRLTVKKRK